VLAIDSLYHRALLLDSVDTPRIVMLRAVHLLAEDDFVAASHQEHITVTGKGPMPWARH